MSAAPNNDLRDQIHMWFEERRPRFGAWDEVEVRELKSIPSFGDASRRRRFDVVFRYGPLSNAYPATGARSCAAALPSYIDALGAEGLLDGLARGHTGPSRQQESTAEDEHVTLEVSIPLTVELLGLVA